MSSRQLSIESRIQGLLWGSFTGDALAMGVHWIYGAADIRKETGELESFIDPVGKAREYHPEKQAGDFTHYGDQTLCLLRSLSENQGWNPEDYIERWRRIFDGESTPYRDHATKDTLHNLENGVPPKQAGSGSREMGGAARFAPVAALLADQPLEEKVRVAREQAELTHRGAGVAECAEFLCRAVHAVLNGAEISNGLDQAALADHRELDLQRLLFQARFKADMPVEDAVRDLGPDCALPGALMSSLRIAMAFPRDPRSALIANAMAGGDSASRGLVIGALCGAAGGVEALPAEWMKNLRAGKEIKKALGKPEVDDDGY